MSSDLVSRTSESDKELVIIRRRTESSYEAAHSGIWKIAYADFMTAMMAFFLIMWLLNATDQQTIKAVANYFNPVKLTDRVSNPKGLHEMNDARRSGIPMLAPQVVAENGFPADGVHKPMHAEEALFQNPYGILAALAAKAQTQEQDDLSNTRGTVHRDPFTPAARTPASKVHAPEATEEVLPLVSAVAAIPQDLVPSSAIMGANRDAGKSEAKSSKVEPQDEHPRLLPEKSVAEHIRIALRDALAHDYPNVDVAETSEGILISLTDEFDFGMFAIASAEPRPELVVIMEKIARVIKNFPGPLIVRGHTDGRPFRSESYDNWRLSSARAHMAYFMLVRGGVDEQRFERIEGHADRNLRVAGDPEAAQNRRIEILLRNAGAS